VFETGTTLCYYMKSDYCPVKIKFCCLDPTRWTGPFEGMIPGNRFFPQLKRIPRWFLNAAGGEPRWPQRVSARDLGNPFVGRQATEQVEPVFFHVSVKFDIESCQRERATIFFSFSKTQFGDLNAAQWKKNSMAKNLKKFHNDVVLKPNTINNTT
jgi:hypothetical protein